MITVIGGKNIAHDPPFPYIQPGQIFDKWTRMSINKAILTISPIYANEFR